ncbi:hypothetical protein D7X55_33980, partial [Corallococcus sp. AB049A]|uniref:putative metal-binding motif-containing protein n=1 Tax=Corallococcus sp. AB049A TaxID=2316721 RepID=UPI000EDCE20B
MYRLCLLGCVMFLAACGEKAPEEGAIRVSVKYGTFKPACLRVEAKDAQGHQEATDIPAAQFKNPDKKEVLVAVRRKADWDTTLSVTVTSYVDPKCTGPAVETFTDAALQVVPKKFTDFKVTLEAVDGDEDGYPSTGGREWTGVPDCDDKRKDVYPGAPEQCDTAVDFDCDGKKACADSKCADRTCTDASDLCTVGRKCIGIGEAAQCGGGEPKCKQSADQCQTSVTCEPSTGACIEGTVAVGASCDTGNLCITNGRCTADKQCVGDMKTCNLPATPQCQAATGSCNPTNGNCEYAPKPATTVCTDGNVCHAPGTCDGNGTCIGKDTPCPPRECNTVAGCTANNSCIYAPDSTRLNMPCSEDNSGTPRVCRADGQCIAFPYTPANFNPSSITGGEINDLRTTGAVVFDTDAKTWTPAGAGPGTGDITIKTQKQTGGPDILLIPVRNLALGGELRIVGSRPLILAVFGDATLNHDILASGRIVNGVPVSGAGGNQQCTASQGKNGAFAGSEGGGGGGAGGATAGAIGGKGYDANANPGAPGAQQASAFTPFFGGCAGGNGAGKGGATGGLGGASGGAFQLSVARTLTVSRTLSVSGGGGLGGKATTSPQAAGGGGGGSGGRIVLEAFQVNLTSDARLTANGGGGGQGGGANGIGANDGANGASGSENSGSSAVGGTGASLTGGAGGAGGSSTNPVAGSEGTTGLGATGGGG